MLFCFCELWYNGEKEEAVTIMQYILAVMIGYLLGCSSMAFYVSLVKKKDIRTAGSGNLGASNATVLFGWGAGVLVALHDIGKAVLAVFLARWLFPGAEYAGAAAGVACVLGHMYPFYLGFRGGKGLASLIGMTIAVNFPVALGVVILLAVVTVTTNYIALGTMALSVVIPIALWVVTGDVWMFVVLLPAAVVMVYKHMENVKRIAAGTEIGLRSTAKGEHRVK